MEVSVIGASGYTGVELLRLLALHPKAKVVGITSEQSQGQSLTSVYPGFKGFFDHCPTLQAIGKPSGKDSWPGLDALLEKSKFFFTALPHGTAMNCVKYLRKKGAKVIDLSADFRFDDVKTYESWYQKHEAPELLKEAVYGLPEFHRKKIQKANLIATPGCYPTSAILALAPFLAKKMIDPSSIIIDSKSGASGAGRGAKVDNLFSEIADSIRAYSIACHRHTPEMEQEMAKILGSPIKITFTPHLIAASRGILTVAYGTLTQNVSAKELNQVAKDYYEKENFIRVFDQESPLPAIRNVRGSYYCDLSIRLDERTNRLIVVSVLDNLCRGASGLSVASMNLMNGYPEEMGLNQIPLFP